MQSKARTPVSREAIIYFRNGARDRSVLSLDAERPQWLVELEAIDPHPSIGSEPVVYFRNDGKPRLRRPSIGGAKRHVRKHRA